MSRNQEGNKVNRKRRHNDDGYETRNKLQKSADNDVASTSIVTTDDVENVCCVCFQLYLGEEENTDWIQCACGRWLHEDCMILYMISMVESYSALFVLCKLFFI